MTTYCQYPSDNHSKDRFTVWHGAEIPLHLCGFHATQFDINKVLERIREIA